MPEKCTDNIRDCPILPRVEALEEAQKQHGETHRGMYDRLNSLERKESAQEVQLKTIIEKLDKLTDKVDALEAKPAKRWEALVGQVIALAVAALVGVVLARIGLG